MVWRSSENIDKVWRMSREEQGLEGDKIVSGRARGP